MTGAARPPLYGVWAQMRYRCENKDHPSYQNYGARGICVDPTWSSFTAFQEWASSSGYERGLWIERIDNDGPYSPANCRWATREEQTVNKRATRRVSAFGETKALSLWATDERCQVSYAGLHHRIAVMGCDAELAITAPPRGICRNGHPRPGSGPCLFCYAARKVRHNTARQARREARTP